jgi:hypothetical protein
MFVALRWLITQGDGSVTLFFHMYQCNMAPYSHCPPFVNLELTSKVDYGAPEGPGYAPYIGARHSKDTYASYLPFKADN